MAATPGATTTTPSLSAYPTDSELSCFRNAAATLSSSRTPTRFWTTTTSERSSADSRDRLAMQSRDPFPHVRECDRSRSGVRRIDVARRTAIVQSVQGLRVKTAAVFICRRCTKRARDSVSDGTARVGVCRGSGLQSSMDKKRSASTARLTQLPQGAKSVSVVIQTQCRTSCSLPGNAGIVCGVVLQVFCKPLLWYNFCEETRNGPPVVN